VFDSDSEKNAVQIMDERYSSVSVPFSPINTITRYRCEDENKQMLSLVSYPNNREAKFNKKNMKSTESM
jgi:hypothetical protein